jgi:cytochrome c553
MSTEKLFSWRNPWFGASVGATVVLAVTSLVVGFGVLPYAEPNARFVGIWEAICSAAGVPRSARPSEGAPVEPGFATSKVVLPADVLTSPDSRAVGRGATLAMQCAICHGSNRQGQVDTPNLEGQPAASVYKELRDFKSGARTSVVMSPFAVNLSERDTLDLASYYSYLPRQPGTRADASVRAPSIVTHGAAMRNIPACSSCHGAVEFKAGSPWLDGQSAVYLKAQLEAFKSGARHNDISGQMRNIARRMTPGEMEEAGAYYASRP